MRVCLLSPHFPPVQSGIGDYTYFLANALALGDCTVDVVTSSGEGDDGLYPLVPGVMVHRVVGKWGLRALPQLVRAIVDLNPQVLVVQYAPHAYDRRGITLGVNLLPAVIRMTSRIRVVVNFHEVHVTFNRLFTRCLASLWQRAMAFLIATPGQAVTVACSEWVTRLRRSGAWKPIQVIPVGSSIPRVRIGTEQAEGIRRELGLHGGAILVGGFGAAGRDRDLNMLLEAIARLKEEYPVKLVWLGDPGFSLERYGDIERLLETRGLSDDVLWTGSLPHPRISALMSVCDLFVMPFVDGVSLRRTSLAAALGHALPILATKGKHVDRVFAHGENIYLVDVGDREGFAQGLLELTRRQDLRARLAEGALKLHNRCFDWRVLAHEVMGVASGP